MDRAADAGRATFGVVGAGDRTPRLVTLERTVRSVGDPVRAARGPAAASATCGWGSSTRGRPTGSPRSCATSPRGGAARFVVDLRGTGGGAFQEAVAAASLFLDDGAPVVTVVERSGGGGGADRRETRREAPPPAPRLRRRPPPRVQLWLDGGTASASEIFAGALRDNCAAALAGRPSFGKGKIQAVFGLADDSGLIVTVANYLTPAGTAIQGVGLTPEAGLRGPGLGLLEPPLPSAAQFDDAWDHRVCATK